MEKCRRTWLSDRSGVVSMKVIEVIHLG